MSWATLHYQKQTVIFCERYRPGKEIFLRNVTRTVVAPLVCSWVWFFILGGILVPPPWVLAQGGSAPDGVDILLPRGGIPAVFDPKFVSASEADIPDDAWVLGVVIDGEAHAYSLNLLNHHEVVNDRFGELPVAAVW